MISWCSSVPRRRWWSVGPVLLMLLVLLLSSTSPAVGGAAFGQQGAGRNVSCMHKFFLMSDLHPGLIRSRNLEAALANAGLDMPRVRSGRYHHKLQQALGYPAVVTALEECSRGEKYYCRKYPPCHNGGTCELDQLSLQYKCKCKAGYRGPSCDSSLNEVSTGVTKDEDEPSCMMGYIKLVGIGEEWVRKFRVEERLSAAGLGKEEIVNVSYSAQLDRALHGTTLGATLRECMAGKLYHCRYLPPCLNNASCTVDATSRKYYCRCPVGYTGFTCGQDIDECSTLSKPCNGTMSCQNTMGSYICNTEDIDECATGHHNCRSDQICKNTIGSYSCSDEGVAESIAELLDSIEVKVNRRRNRKPKVRVGGDGGGDGEQARRSRKRYRKLLQRLDDIADSMRRIAGVDPNVARTATTTAASATAASPEAGRRPRTGLPAM